MEKMIKKKLAFLCSSVIVFSVAFALIAVNNGKMTDVTTATAKTYYAENTESTATTRGSLGDAVSSVVGGIGSGSGGGIGDIIGGIGSGSGGGIGDIIGGIGSGSGGGIGDAIGGIGEALGGLTGGATTEKTTSAPATTSSANGGLIIPVPAATQNTTVKSETTTTTEAESTAGETVDYSATSNPYTKPTKTFKAGDRDESIKWIQWIFVYTHYGLDEKGITGVLDENTVAVVKKLQQENGLTADGNITEDVIRAAEVLYYKTVLGGDVSAVEVSLETTTGAPATVPTQTTEGQSNVSGVLLIIVLVIIWVLAIGGIVLLFVFRKKKISSRKGGKTVAESNADSGEKNESKDEKQGTISSLSDLFEEADKEDK